ncbi:MAG: DMT family transporter [Pseudomonadales bacterium]|nr:DMT family transporter [Pseudomonadales bacterium]
MIDSWVFWTLLAATMQSVRFATQKYLTDDISPFAATLVRYLFGLPFALIWLLWWREGAELPPFNTTFVMCCLLAGVSQVVATVLVMHIFTLRTFAVGSTLIRSEIVITALLGFTFFAETITPSGWIAIVVCAIGLMLIGVSKSSAVAAETVTGSWWSLLANRETVYGLVAALCFSLTSLLIRKGSLSFELSEPVFTAALTLFVMVCWQTLICVAWLMLREPGQMRRVFVRWRPGLFVGLTSVVGSVGWFTAFTLEFASYVKTLGQIEFLFTLIISLYVFKEIPRRLEMFGMFLILAGVITLLLS